jgi:hypothetical protein
MTDFAEAMRCAERARDLARDLDKVRGPGDLGQIAAGLRLEVDCIIQRLSDGLDALRAPVTGDRTGKVRNDALGTSQEAARLISVKSGSQRAKVLLALYRWGDLTDFEIQQRLELDQNSERPRRGELVDAFMVQAVTNGQGAAITRRHNGRDWQVWSLTEDGATVAFDLEAASGKETGGTAAQSLF